MESYPTFKRGQVQTAFKKLSKVEREIIEMYVKYVSITSQSRTRLENNKRGLTEFRIITKKSLEDINLQDLRDFLAILNHSSKTQSTRNDLKHTIKRFLKWKYKDWSERFDNLSDIKLVMKMNEEKINANTILSKEDIEKIMEKEPTLFWKTFFITLYESGLRPQEVRNLLWKDIKFDIIKFDDKQDLSEINIYATKTHKARSVYVKIATSHLKLLKKSSETDLVFPSVRDKTRPINKENASEWLRKISNKVLGRQIYPYILRHTRATELYTNSGIPDKTVQKFLGHSKSMADVYTHLSNKDVKEAVANTIYKIEEMPEKLKNELEERIKIQESQLKELSERFSILLAELEGKKSQELTPMIKFLSLPLNVQEEINNKLVGIPKEERINSFEKLVISA